MLILQREIDEKVIIETPDGTQITVCVVRMRRGKVRLGFTAPKEVTIDREEVFNRRIADRG